MPAIVWREKMRIGVPAIDNDHQALIAIINQFEKVMSGSRFRPDLVTQILSRFGDYTQKHFAREEAVMARVGFPGLEAHAKAHAACALRFWRLQRSFVALPTREEAVDIQNLLTEWLIRHVISADLELAVFLRRGREGEDAAKPITDFTNWNSAA